jgi:hypothetical protein
MNAQKPRGLDFFYPAHWVATMKGTAGEWPEEKRELGSKIWYTGDGDGNEEKTNLPGYLGD